jgi:hypothetical protein
LRHGDAEDDKPNDDVDQLPDLELAHADERLGVDRFGQREIERPEPHVFHEAGQTRPNHELGDPGHEGVDPDDRQ